MPEFVNPKFQDEGKTKFKPTRLECLMQDFPRLFADGSGCKVGFTKYDRWLCFTCVKNNLEDARKKSAGLQPPDCCFSCEADMYYCANRLLLLAGKEAGEKVDVESVEAELAAISEPTEFLGIKKELSPSVVLLPSFALSLAQLRTKTGGKPIQVSKGSSLVVEGNITFNGLSLEGALDLRCDEAAKMELPADVEVKNMGAKLATLLEEKLDTDFLKIRGYDLEKQEVWDLATLCQKTEK
mmetsp:Transcript_3937/g.9618  ORF Transcript_3937/g.9618 Transcript_3937/m.9618 type:complete len:240 (-) Transcript_3937:503-1222(-)